MGGFEEQFAEDMPDLIEAPAMPWMKGVPGNLDHVADITWAMFDRYIIRYIIHKWSFRMLKY